jgi:hypothetical protein
MEPPDGEGKLAPSPEATVIVVAVSKIADASVELTGWNANSRIPRKGA